MEETHPEGARKSGKRTHEWSPEALPIVGLVMAITSTGVVGATIPAKNGRMAFDRFGVGKGVQSSVIFVTKADGTNEERITRPTRRRLIRSEAG